MSAEPVATTGARRIEDCRGDFEAIAAMIDAAWARSATPPFRYTSEYLASCFDYPGAELSLAPTMYDGASPIAFVAGFPRRVRVADRTCTILLISLLTASAQHQDRGYGIVIWSELVRRARAAGFDGMVNYCVEGEAMNRMIVGSCRRLRLPVERIHSVGYLSKILPPVRDRPALERIEPLVDAFMRAAAPISWKTPLAREWSRPEANWQCSRAGAVTAHRESSSSEGVLSGYVMEVANARRTKCLLVDDVLWGGLAADDCRLLVAEFVARAAAAGAQIAVVPRQGYAELGPFEQVGFRPSNRVVHTYLSLWGDIETPRSVPAFYLDVS